MQIWRQGGKFEFYFLGTKNFFLQIFTDDGILKKKKKPVKIYQISEKESNIGRNDQIKQETNKFLR